MKQDVFPARQGRVKDVRNGWHSYFQTAEL